MGWASRQEDKKAPSLTRHSASVNNFDDMIFFFFSNFSIFLISNFGHGRSFLLVSNSKKFFVV